MFSFQVSPDRVDVTCKEHDEVIGTVLSDDGGYDLEDLIEIAIRHYHKHDRVSPQVFFPERHIEPVRKRVTS